MQLNTIVGTPDMIEERDELKILKEKFNEFVQRVEIEQQRFQIELID